jgi:hypothetical protein
MFTVEFSELQDAGLEARCATRLPAGVRLEINGCAVCSSEIPVQENHLQSVGMLLELAQTSTGEGVHTQRSQVHLQNER